MLKAMSKFQGVLKMFMLGMLKTILKTVFKYKKNTITLYSTCSHETYMSHFSYMCKMRYPLNLVLESWEYLWSYLTFWVVIVDSD